MMSLVGCAHASALTLLCVMRPCWAMVTPVLTFICDCASVGCAHSSESSFDNLHCLTAA